MTKQNKAYSPRDGKTETRTLATIFLTSILDPLVLSTHKAGLKKFTSTYVVGHTSTFKCRKEASIIEAWPFHKYFQSSSHVSLLQQKQSCDTFKTNQFIVAHAFKVKSFLFAFCFPLATVFSISPEPCVCLA